MMKPRIAYSIRHNGRHFTRKGLEAYRSDLCVALRSAGKTRLADRYQEMTLEQFGAQGGYVIVKH